MTTTEVDEGKRTIADMKAEIAEMRAQRCNNVIVPLVVMEQLIDVAGRVLDLAEMADKIKAKAMQ